MRLCEDDKAKGVPADTVDEVRMLAYLDDMAEHGA